MNTCRYHLIIIVKALTTHFNMDTVTNMSCILIVRKSQLQLILNHHH